MSRPGVAPRWRAAAGAVRRRTAAGAGRRRAAGPQASAAMGTVKTTVVGDPEVGVRTRRTDHGPTSSKVRPTSVAPSAPDPSGLTGSRTAAAVTPGRLTDPVTDEMTR